MVSEGQGEGGKAMAAWLPALSCVLGCRARRGMEEEPDGFPRERDTARSLGGQSGHSHNEEQEHREKYSETCRGQEGMGQSRGGVSNYPCPELGVTREQRGQCLAPNRAGPSAASSKVRTTHNSWALGGTPGKDFYKEVMISPK